MIPFGKQQEILRDLSTSSPDEVSGNCREAASRSGDPGRQKAQGHLSKGSIDGYLPGATTERTQNSDSNPNKDRSFVYHTRQVGVCTIP